MRLLGKSDECLDRSVIHLSLGRSDVSLGRSDVYLVWSVMHPGSPGGLKRTLYINHNIMILILDL